MAGHLITTYFESLRSYDVYNSSVEPFNKKTIIIDAFDRTTIKAVLSAVRPDIVINCAGILIQASENNPDIAFYINSFFPLYLSRLGREFGFKLIQMSTDCVFSGEKGGYLEGDIKDGRGYYAQSKIAGEIVNDVDLTFRMSIVGPEINKKGTGLLHWFLHQKGEINGFVNTWWTGITTLELAKGMRSAIEQNLTGLYHFVPPSKISKYDLLSLFNEVWGRGVKINRDERAGSDKSLVNTRRDFDYNFKSYKQMLIELKEWMDTHQDLYKDYVLQKNH